MAHNTFGWDLPPGCSMQDIERAVGSDQDALADFEVYCEDNPKFLTEAEKEVLDIISNDYSTNLKNNSVQQLIYKIIDWAWQQGYNQGKLDESQYQNYERTKELNNDRR